MLSFEKWCNWQELRIHYQCFCRELGPSVFSFEDYVEHIRNNHYQDYLKKFAYRIVVLDAMPTVNDALYYFEFNLYKYVINCVTVPRNEFEEKLQSQLVEFVNNNLERFLEEDEVVVVYDGETVKGV